jgi:hypothetical protein
MNAKYFAELAMSPSAPIRRKSKQKFFLVEQQILLTFSRAFIKYGLQINPTITITQQ